MRECWAARNEGSGDPAMLTAVPATLNRTCPIVMLPPPLCNLPAATCRTSMAILPPPVTSCAVLPATLFSVTSPPADSTLISVHREPCYSSCAHYQLKTQQGANASAGPHTISSHAQRTNTSPRWCAQKVKRQCSKQKAQSTCCCDGACDCTTLSCDRR